MYNANIEGKVIFKNEQKKLYLICSIISLYMKMLYDGFLLLHHLTWECTFTNNIKIINMLIINYNY